MNKIKQWWNEYYSTGGSHVIWAARFHAFLGFLGTVVFVMVSVLHENTALLSAFTTDQALLAEAQIAIGIFYEVMRRYHAEDL